MQDGIIAGNGNSRYLKTVSAALGLYPTYEDFMAALIAGTFPIDLNGINAAGWTQQGTALNKANLLADTTATSLGLSTSATPNDALSKLNEKIKNTDDNLTSRMKGTIVSYIGTGGYGASTPCSITASFPIKAAIWLLLKRNIYEYTRLFVVSDSLTTSYTEGYGFYGSSAGLGNGIYAKISSDKKTISWYSVNDGYTNDKGETYYFLVVG